MAENGKVKIKIDADDSGFQKSLEGLEGKAKKAVSGIGSVGSAVAKGVAAASAALVAAGTAVTAVGSVFESAFAKVQTIMDTTQLSMEDMQAQILKLSESTGVSAASLSDSVYNAISATGDTANAVSLVESATKMAAAGFTDTESALGVVTTAMNAYGLSADEAMKISDSLVQTQNIGVTTISELSASMGKAIASASAYGVDLYNVEAAYVAMTKSGINTAESTTYMSSMFKELGSESSKIGKILKKETGKSFSELMASGADLADILKVVYDAAGQDSAALMNMWGSAEAGKAANAIINQGLEAFDENLGSIRESSGLTETAYATMTETVQHQTEALKNSVKNLGISLFDSFKPQISDMLGEVNGWMTTMTSAFQSGGIDGLANAASQIAPQLITKITGMLETGLSTFAGKLPGLVKNLMSAVPSLLKSITTLAPQIASSLFTGLSAAVESLVGMLPELVPMLADGIGGLFGSIFTGVNGVFAGFDAGVVSMLKQLGMLSYTATDNWDRVMKSVDATAVKDIAQDVEATFTLDTNVEVDTEEVKQQLENAASAIKTICTEGIEDPATAEEIANAVINGDTTTLLKDALVSLGLSEEDAASAAKVITDAQTNINNAIMGLGISQEAKDHVATLAADGATKEEIKTYLISQGMDGTEADAAAASITAEQAKIDAACLDLGVDSRTVAIIKYGLRTDREAICSALEILGLNQEDVQSILDSYDTIANSLSAGLPSIFESITNTLTDGKADTPDQISELETQVRGWAKDAYTKLQEWYTSEIESLNASGLTGQELDDAIAGVDEKYSALSAGIKTTEEETIAWIGSMSGKATAYVKGHLGELQVIQQQAETIAAQIDSLALSAENENQYSASRRLTVSGRTQDTRTQLEAIKLTAAEYEAAVSAATEEYDAAVADAQEKLKQGAITDGEYAELERQAAEKWSAAMETAGGQYDAWMNQIIQGIAAASPQFAQKLQELAGEAETADVGAKLFEGIRNSISDAAATGELISTDDLIAQLGIGEADMAALAEKLGFSDADALKAAITSTLQTAFGSNAGETELMTDLEGLQQSVSDAYAALFAPENLDTENGISSNVAKVLSAAIDAGWVTATSGIDWTSGDAITGAITSMGKAIEEGSNNVPIAISKVKATVDTVELDTSGTTFTETGTASEATVTEPVTATVPVETDAEIVEGETGSVEEQVAEETQAQLTDAETGAPVKLVQNATVDLNVTATISGTDFTQAGSAAAMDFAIGIASVSASEEAKGLADGALKELGNAKLSAMVKGYDFASGYAKGISSGTDLAISAAIKMAKRALSAVAETQQSASPSKAAAKLGTYFGEGYEQGIRESMRNAIDTARTMTGELLNASVAGSNGLGVIRVEAGSEPLQVETVGDPTPVNINGVKVAEIQANANRSSINMENRRYKRALGG